MADGWYRFDDGVVHKVNIGCAYSVNMVFYRLSTVPAYKPPMSLESILELGKSIILNWKKSGQDNNIEPSNNKNLCSSGSMNEGPPPLISSQPSTSTNGATHSESQTLGPEILTRRQPSRGSKDFVVYFGADSQSSVDETPPDRTHPDTDYIPDDNTGSFLHGTLLSNI